MHIKFMLHRSLITSYISNWYFSYDKKAKERPLAKQSTIILVLTMRSMDASLLELIVVRFAQISLQWMHLPSLGCFTLCILHRWFSHTTRKLEDSKMVSTWNERRNVRCALLRTINSPLPFVFLVYKWFNLTRNITRIMKFSCTVSWRQYVTRRKRTEATQNQTH